MRTAVLLIGDHQRAEDLVQEALTHIAPRWRRHRHGPPDAYARQILVRDNISWWRTHRAELVVDVDDPRRTLDDLAERDAVGTHEFGSVATVTGTTPARRPWSPATPRIGD